jgi:WD repeat-containing protein 44
VSFLIRFIGGNKKKDEAESEYGDTRPEGTDAQLFSQPTDNMGFSPHHPQPPAYIRMKSRFKRERQFDRVFLAQELRARGTPDPRKRMSSGANKGPSSASLSGNDPIWALEFSKDGKYLAAGGQDKAVRVWAIISSPQERRKHETEEETAGGPETEFLHLSAPVFQAKVFRTYMGHTSTVLDLSWSKVCSLPHVLTRFHPLTRAEQLPSLLIHGQNGPALACQS